MRKEAVDTDLATPTDPGRRHAWARLLVVLGLLMFLIAWGNGCSDGARTRAAPAKRVSPGRKPSAQFEPRPYISRELKVHFEVLDGGRLAVGLPEGGSAGAPLEAFERLFLVYKDRALRIDDLALLGGRVRIRTPAEALELCRLRSSPSTYFVWDEVRLEVVGRDEINVGFCFGDEKEWALIRTDSSGYYGIVESRARLRKLGIRPTSAFTSYNGFEVERTFLGGNPATRLYYTVQCRELVTRDGNYSVLDIGKRRPTGIAGVNWVIPNLY